MFAAFFYSYTQHSPRVAQAPMKIRKTTQRGKGGGKHSRHSRRKAILYYTHVQYTPLSCCFLRAPTMLIYRYGKKLSSIDSAAVFGLWFLSTVPLDRAANIPIAQSTFAHPIPIIGEHENMSLRMTGSWREA